MAGTKISAEETTVGAIFTNRYRFSVPTYQRPYAWTTEQAGEMFDDLFGAAMTKASLSEADPYFLGSVVLVKREGEADADIVDGQQRLTTLTILLAALRERSTALAEDINERIFQKGSQLTGTKAQPRLRIRPSDQGFFEKHVQKPQGEDDLEHLVLDQLPTDSQRNIVANFRSFLGRLDDLEQDQRETLARFIELHTYVVVVATQDFESAYRIFTVLNERGLDLSHTDILKAEIIGQTPDEDKDAYTTKWQTEEDDLGREAFADLFAHIRMVFAKTKARGTVLKEFRAAVLSKYPEGRVFIDDVLVPFSNAYEIVTRQDYASSMGADEVNQLLMWLNKLDNSDWVSPAISYLRRGDVTAEQVCQFLADLERLAASMFVRRVDITRRIERYGRVLEWMEGGDDLYTARSPLQLGDTERDETIARLNDDVYNVTRIRLYVLLRLDSVVSTGGASYDHSTTTVEHVLPQNPAEGSQWRLWFADDQRQQWTHRLANLVLLTRRKNSQAGTFEFEVKKQKYFSMVDGVSPFALTSQVLAESTWTPQLLERRQRDLVAKLVSLWRL